MAAVCPSCRTSSSVPMDHVTRLDLAAGYSQLGLGINIDSMLPQSLKSIDLHRCSRCDLLWYDPIQPGDAAFYELLQQHDLYYQDDKPEFATVGATVNDAAHVLEIGCGKGAFVKHLPPSTRYRGLEFNDKAVEMACLAGLDVEKKSIEDEAITSPEKYDVVCHFQVLEHVPSPSAFMRACAAVVKPGGQLVVTVPAEDSFLSVAPRNWLNMPPHHMTRWTDRALQSLFESIGMAVERIWHEPVASYHREQYDATMARLALAQWVNAPAALAAPRSNIDRVAFRLGRLPMVRRWMVKEGERRFSAACRGMSVTVFGRRLEA